MPRRRTSLSHSSARPFILSAGCRDHGVNSRCHAATEIAGLETGCDLIGNNAFADCIRERALQTVPGLDPHFPVFHKHEEYGAVIPTLLARFPRAKCILGEILYRRARGQTWVNDYQYLV
jgi:hypothetical protein